MEARYGIEGATHDYSGVVVLRNVDFEMCTSTVHALVGANGSGKSTLIKILTGAVRPALGRLYADDRDVTLRSPADAEHLGVSVVHQDYHLFPHLTVAENIVGVTQPPPRRRFTKVVDKAAVDEQVRTLLGQLNIALPTGALVGGLGPAERKFVEIARAMLPRPRFLILDEPTASLEPRAARSVVGLLERLRENGVGIVLVSHRLDEVSRLADRATVLRDGERVALLSNREAGEEQLARLIVGDAQETLRAARAHPTRTAAVPALSLSGVRLAPNAATVDLDVAPGEIVGVTGLLGSGARKLVRMIGGAEPLAGHAKLAGRPVSIRSPRDAARLGIGFIPEDRVHEGLLGNQSVSVNIALASLSTVSVGGVLRKGQMDEMAAGFRRRLGIRTPSVHMAARTLSGGNQQKVLLARWLASQVKVLAIDEPTHGIDVGAKVQVHDLLSEFADAGGALVVSSTDVDELLVLCNRIVVMRHGTVAASVPAAELTQEAITVLGARDAEHYLESLIEG